MNAAGTTKCSDGHLSHPLTRRRKGVPLHQILFALFGGPLAWFLQLNAAFALATQPCFLDDQSLAPQPLNGWSTPAMVAILACAGVIAYAAMLTAWCAYRHTQLEGGDQGRTRFLALWGICLGLGSTLAFVLTALVFFVLPRCAG
jgi:sterol desaturase/sphingolipid hydroxylase (fatty acid hydroxylase superfamily)